MPKNRTLPTRQRPTLTLKRYPIPEPPKPAPEQFIPRPMDHFFINWRAEGYRPKKRHSTMERALAERDRLRAAYPGSVVQTFECQLIQPDEMPVEQPAE